MAVIRNTSLTEPWKWRGGSHRGVTEPVASGRQGVGQGGRTKAVRVPHPLGLLVWDVRPSAAQGIIPPRMKAALTSSLPLPPGARTALTVPSARHTLESALQILDPESSAQGSRLGLAPRFLEHPHLFEAPGEQKQGSNRHLRAQIPEERAGKKLKTSDRAPLRSGQKTVAQVRRTIPRDAQLTGADMNLEPKPAASTQDSHSRALSNTAGFSNVRRMQ